MGSCQVSNKGNIFVTLDLTSIRPHSPPQSISIDPTASLLCLFNQLDVPKSTPPCCYQLHFRGRTVPISHKTLASCGVQSGDVLEVVGRKSEDLKQIEVTMETSNARFSLWVKRKATVRSLLVTISKTLRLPSEELRLLSGSAELLDTLRFEELADSSDLRLQLRSQPRPAHSPGLTLELTCENADCQCYLQRQTQMLGVGNFDLGEACEKTRCKECNQYSCLLEGMQFRACAVRYEGIQADGNEGSGSQTFGDLSGELFQGARVKWRKVRLVVSV